MGGTDLGVRKLNETMGDSIYPHIPACNFADRRRIQGGRDVPEARSARASLADLEGGPVQVSHLDGGRAVPSPVGLARLQSVHPKLGRLGAAALLTTVLCGLSGEANAQLREEQRIEIAEQLQRSTVVVRVGRSGGSGFVATREGWVITNFHVVQGFRQQRVTLTYPNGRQAQARVLAYDRAHDLALLAPHSPVEAPPLPLADPDGIRVGQTVLAYGSPFGLDGTLTQGIVSARRDIPRSGGETVEGLIQTDAPINPGNSGGPLVNSRGRVIGVNTMILSRTGGSNGIGFAMPANYVSELVAEVRRSQQAEAQQAAAPPEAPPTQPRPPANSGDRPAPEVAENDAPSPRVWLGIAGDDFRSRRLAGVRVRRVFRNGPAHQAGVRGVGDRPPRLVRQLRIPWTGHIIVAVDDRPVRSLRELRQAISARRPGQRAKLSLAVGSDAVRQEAVVVLQAAPSRPPR